MEEELLEKTEVEWTRRRNVMKVRQKMKEECDEIQEAFKKLRKRMTEKEMVRGENGESEEKMKE